ncbi:MAG: hypothetical protein R3C11_07190 [Planctomycetaceae bacterium]
MGISLLTSSNSPLFAEIKIARFNVDATPEIGEPVAYAPVRSIVDPLSARGVVLLFDNQSPVVLCAVDWIGIYNNGQDVWKAELAKAAGTTPDRVSVHALHQHDGPRCDFWNGERTSTAGTQFGRNFFQQ